MAAIRMKWADFRKMENADRVEREYVNSVANFRKDRKQKIADEKRKWQVRYTTPDGKPDKKRRPGRPWDPSVLAKPDHMTHTPLVDLTAEIRANDSVLKPGSDESVERSLNRAALQHYLDQVNTYEQMLMPIQNILSTTFGGAPNHKTPEKQSSAIGDDSMQTSPARSNMPDFDQYHDDPSVLSDVDGSSTGDSIHEKRSLDDMSSVTLPAN